LVQTAVRYNIVTSCTTTKGPSCLRYRLVRKHDGRQREGLLVTHRPAREFPASRHNSRFRNISKQTATNNAAGLHWPTHTLHGKTGSTLLRHLVCVLQVTCTIRASPAEDTPRRRLSYKRFVSKKCERWLTCSPNGAECEKGWAMPATTTAKHQILLLEIYHYGSSTATITETVL
jgi:hypothetical protein